MEFNHPLSAFEISGPSAEVTIEDVLAVVRYDSRDWHVEEFAVVTWSRATRSSVTRSLTKDDPLEALIIAAAEKQIALAAVASGLEYAWLEKLVEDRDLAAMTGAEYRAAA